MLSRVPCSAVHARSARQQSWRFVVPPSLVAASPAKSAIGTRQTRCRSTLSPRGDIPWLQEVTSWRTGKASEGLPTSLDAVLVLAGGQTPDGGVPPVVERRLDAGLQVAMLQNPTCPVLCVGGGSPHKPPVVSESGNYVIHESWSCAEYLIAKGLSSTNILKETSSFDTVGNCYFSLFSHAVPAGWRRIAVVTSHFHMPRSQALYEDMFKLAAHELFDDPNRFSLWFVSVSDEGLFPPEVLQSRRQREAASLLTWRGNSAKITSIKKLHSWLFDTHLCYSVSRQGEWDVAAKAVDDKALASY